MTRRKPAVRSFMQRSSSSYPPIGYSSSNPPTARKLSARTARQNPTSRAHSLVRPLLARRRPSAKSPMAATSSPRYATSSTSWYPDTPLDRGPAAPTSGSVNGASNSSSQPPCTMVSLFKKTMTSPRDTAAP